MGGPDGSVVKAFAINPDNLNLIPVTHVIGEKLHL